MTFDDLSEDDVTMLFRVGECETYKLVKLFHLHEDIIQQYWVEVLRNIHSYNRSKGAITTWAKKVHRTAARKVLVNHLQQGFRFRGRKGGLPEGKTPVSTRPAPGGNSQSVHEYCNNILPTNLPRRDHQ